MKNPWTAALLLAALVALPAQAQPAAEAARPKATDGCQGKNGEQRRRCQRDTMPSADCAKARDPQRCEAMRKAQQACQDKFGPELRQCIEAHRALPKKP